MTGLLPGDDRIRELIAGGELQRIVAGGGRQWLDKASSHLAAAEELRHAAAPAPIFTLTYRSAHAAMRALLAQQGLRATNSGGDRALAVAVQAQFGLRAFEAMRRRHEYIENHETQVTATLSASEVDRALTQARELVRRATALLDELGEFR